MTHHSPSLVLMGHVFPLRVMHHVVVNEEKNTWGVKTVIRIEFTRLPHKRTTPPIIPPKNSGKIVLHGSATDIARSDTARIMGGLGIGGIGIGNDPPCGYNEALLNLVIEIQKAIQEGKLIYRDDIAEKSGE